MHLTIADHETPLGQMWSSWSDRGLYSLNWQRPEAESVLASTNTQQRIEQLTKRLADFFQGGQESFSSIAIDRSGWTDFMTQIYDCCRLIEPGTTLTYKELAQRAGNEKASRAVGAAMARNRILLVIPCHRVVSAGGELRGFSAPGGLATKRLLLELERQRVWPRDLFSDAPT